MQAQTFMDEGEVKLIPCRRSAKNTDQKKNLNSIVGLARVPTTFFKNYIILYIEVHVRVCTEYSSMVPIECKLRPA